MQPPRHDGALFQPICEMTMTALPASPLARPVTRAARAAVAGLALPTNEAAWSLVAFVVVASVTIALPVAYYLVGGDTAKAKLDSLKDWLAFHNNAVMAVLLLVFGVDLIAKGLPPLL